MDPKASQFVHDVEQHIARGVAQRPLLDLIIEQSGVGIIVADEKGVLRAFNAEAVRQHGQGLHLVSPPEWIRTYNLSTQDGVPIELADLALFKALHGEVVEHFCYVVHPPGGEPRVIVGNANPLRHPDGTCAGAVVISRDETRHVNDAKQLRIIEHDLQRTQEFKKRLIASSPDCLLLMDRRGSIEWMNSTGLHILGLDTTDLRPTRWKHMWEKKTLTAAATALRAAISGRVGRFEGVTCLPDTPARWFSVAVTLVQEAQDTPEQYLASLRDITRIKKAEAQSLRQASFAKRLVGIVSHDLRNPLGAILLTANALSRQAGVTDKSQRALQRVVEAAQRANRLIYDLLDFTAGQLAGGLQLQQLECDVTEIAQRVIDEMRLLHPARTFEISHSGPCRALVDADRMAQLFTNLVGNAVQHGAAQSPIHIGLEQGATQIHLTVHNEGLPISARVQARLFKPLARGSKGSNKTRSIGLGLYIVKLIVDAHGGSIEVLSTYDTGTTFAVSVPIVAVTHVAMPNAGSAQAQ